MTVNFTGKAAFGLDVTLCNPAPGTEPLSGEVMHLSKPAGQDDDSFMREVDAFHEAILRQEHEFAIIAGHWIRPDAVERIALVLTYVDAA
jgi:hypothetical protein